MMDSAAILKDPNYTKSRIFVGNVPICTKDDLLSICNPYGKTIAAMVKEKFGFVQFETENEANRASQALNGSMFNGKKITVRNAALKPAGKKDNQHQQHKQHQQQQQPIQQQNAHFQSQHHGGDPSDNFQVLQEYYHSTVPMDYFDCEIVVLDKEVTLNYAEFIEQRLKRLYLTVDLIFPKSDVPIGKVLANISSRGVLYAVLVNSQNVEHKSITVHTLYGDPLEHRNMPVDDAVNMLTNDFRTKILEEVKIPVTYQHHNLPPVAAPIKSERFDSMQSLLNLLANKMPLTVSQYDRIINYLQECRALQVKVELGETEDNIANSAPDPEIELQKRILNILNKPSIAEKNSNMLYPTVESLLDDSVTIELLKDVKVQKALDSLMITDSLVSTVETSYKF